MGSINSKQDGRDNMELQHNEAGESHGAQLGWKKGWGFLLALLLAGCQGGAGSANSASSGDPSAQNEMRAVHSQANDEAPRLAPVRVSRAIFENELSADVALLDASGARVDELQSAVDWAVSEPIGPAPGPGAIADFRDREGCAWLSAASGQTGVCFRLMGDVSSVGLNDREMRLEGLLEWAQARAPSIRSLELVEATRDSSGFRVSFDATDDRGERYRLEVALHTAASL